MKAMPARIINILLGVWLFISAFAWSHTSAQFTNAWLVGLLVAGFAAAALRVEWARYVNTVLAVWLFLSNWILATAAEATAWNNIIVAIAIFVVSLVGPQPVRRTRARPARPARPRHA